MSDRSRLAHEAAQAAAEYHRQENKQEDKDVEVAALAIEDLLYLIPAEKRAAALARAVEVEARESTERAKHSGFRIIDGAEMAEWVNTPAARYWNAVMRFKARLIYTFTRNITNDHSKKDAARLLFQLQPQVSGSGYLDEYIGDVLEAHRRSERKKRSASCPV